jgi:hypothetical protein
MPTFVRYTCTIRYSAAFVHKQNKVTPGMTCVIAKIR